MPNEILLGEPACPEGCEKCTLRCAAIVMALVDLRRQHEQALRRYSLHRRRNDAEEIAQLETCLESSALAFQRVHPAQKRLSSLPAMIGTSTSARLH